MDLIILGFTLLYFSIDTVSVFVIQCALMACATLFITRYGRNLRTFGNFTFIPALYLACELHNGLPSQDYVPLYFKFLAYSPIALIIIIAFQYTFHFFKMIPSSILQDDFSPYWKRVFDELDKGELMQRWIPPTLAIFFGVLTSAILVSLFQLDTGEWVIWSTASVTTTDFILSKAKLKDRFYGAVFGGAAGICVVFFLPQNLYLYSFSILLIMLTLISFKTYVIGVIFRVFFIVIAASALHAGTHVAFVRVENVLLGGAIGFCFSYFSHYLFDRFSL